MNPNLTALCLALDATNDALSKPKKEYTDIDEMCRDFDEQEDKDDGRSSRGAN